MNFHMIIATFKFLYRPRETLQQFGTFLCREQIAAYESDLAASRLRAERAEDELRKLKHEVVAQTEKLSTLERRILDRADYARIAVAPGATAYALRAGRGNAPRLVCPVCFERGAIVDLAVEIRTHSPYTQFAKQLAHVKCSDGRCSYGFVVTKDAFNHAFKLVD